MLSGGLWKIQTHKKAVAILYVNLITGEQFNCGDQRVDTPIGMLVDWIAENSLPGDAATINGKSVLFKMTPASA